MCGASTAPKILLMDAKLARNTKDSRTKARPAGPVTAAHSEPRDNPAPWWRHSVIYQIAVPSFQDSNGDGVGDLPGLLQRLDHLVWLGVGAIWLTPIYPSPMRDFGYDISDYCAVHPRYGTLDDFDRVVDALHARGIRVILDFVPNHTSDEHAWFCESSSSRTNPKRDWYVWADPGPDGGPPNNWLSRFGGSAWEWHEQTGQYYYHAFLKEQPDLNWRNADVRHAMADVLRFWLRRGVDGFRVDASAVLAEDELLRDDPPDPEADENTPPPQRLKHVFSDDRPDTMQYIEGLRRVVDEFGERLLCGEVQGKTERIGHFYGEERPRLHLPLNFALLDSPWSALSLQAEIDAYVNAIPNDAWPVWVIGGHDKRRIASKIGQAQARILAMLLMALKGTPFFFAGDEIGMEQVPIPEDRIDDPFEKRVPGYGLNRDPERVPMRWNGAARGGFTTGEPWLPLGPHVAERNVEKQKQQRGSLLALYRALIELRRREPALTHGDQVPLRSRNDILVLKRVGGRDEFLIALNLVHEPRKLEWRGEGAIVLSTYLDRENILVRAPLLLRADEGLIIKIASG
jgi:alpha-glucosidase